MFKRIFLFLFFFLFSFSSFFIYADTNGVWINSEDLRGSNFGFDENSFVFNYTFLNPVEINNTLITNSFEVFKDPINNKNLVSVEYVDRQLSNILNCGKIGMIFNGSGCVYVSGANLSVDSFIFTNATGAEFDTFIVSNGITLTGMVNNLNFQIFENETYATIVKNGLDTNSTNVFVTNGDVIRIRMKSLNDFELISSVKIKVGDYETIWSVKSKADKVQVVLSSTTMNFNLYTNQGNPVSPEDYEVIINEGVIIGSTTTSQPAFTTGDLPSGSTVNIVNNGKIQGAGGNGGSAPPCIDCHNQPGYPGGNAIEIKALTLIDNKGEIWSGGGGGSGSSAWWQYGASGGGGAGYVGGIRGVRGANSESNRGYDGTEFLGGNGGFNQPSHEWMYGGRGGDPGERGWSSCGYKTSMTCYRGGGAAGYSVKTNGNTLTWINQGDLRGPIN